MLFLTIRSFIAVKKMKDDFTPAQIIPNLFLGSIGAAMKLEVLLCLLYYVNSIFIRMNKNCF